MSLEPKGVGQTAAKQWIKSIAEASAIIKMEGVPFYVQAAVWAATRVYDLPGNTREGSSQGVGSWFAIIVCANYISLSLAAIALSYVHSAIQQPVVADAVPAMNPAGACIRRLVELLAAALSPLSPKQACLNTAVASVFKCLLLGELTVMGLTQLSGQTYSCSKLHMLTSMLIGIACTVTVSEKRTTVVALPSARFEVSNSLGRSLWKHEHVVLHESITGSQGAFAKFGDLIGTFTDSMDTETARPSPSARPPLQSTGIPEIEEHASAADEQEPHQDAIDPDIAAGASPADIMLDVLQQLLEGQTPDWQELQLLQQYLNQGRDMYAPPIDEEVVVTHMDADVEEALMQRLLGLMPAKATTTMQAISSHDTSFQTSNVDGLLTDIGTATMAYSGAGFSTLRDGLASLMCDCSPLDLLDSTRTARRSSGVILTDEYTQKSRRSSLTLNAEEIISRKASIALDPVQLALWKARLLSSAEADLITNLPSADELVSKGLQLIGNSELVSGKSVFAASSESSSAEAHVLSPYAAKASSRVESPSAEEATAGRVQQTVAGGRPSRESSGNRTLGSQLAAFSLCGLSAVAEDGPATLAPIPAKDMSAAFGSTIALRNPSMDLAFKAASSSGVGRESARHYRRGSVEFLVSALRDHSYGPMACVPPRNQAHSTEEGVVAEPTSDTYTERSDLMQQISSDVSASGRQVMRGSTGSYLPPRSTTSVGAQPSDKRRASSSAVEGDKSLGLKHMSSKLFGQLFSQDSKTTSKKTKQKMKWGLTPTLSSKVHSAGNLLSLEAAGGELQASKGALDMLASAISGKLKKLQSHISKKGSRRGSAIEDKPMDAKVIEAMQGVCRSLSDGQRSVGSNTKADTEEESNIYRRAKSMTALRTKPRPAQLSSMLQRDQSSSPGFSSGRNAVISMFSTTDEHSSSAQGRAVGNHSTQASTLHDVPRLSQVSSVTGAGSKDTSAVQGCASEQLSSSLLKLQPGGQDSVISMAQHAWVLGQQAQACDSHLIRSRASSAAGYLKLSDASLCGKSVDDGDRSNRGNSSGTLGEASPMRVHSNTFSSTKVSPIQPSPRPAEEPTVLKGRVHLPPRRAGTESRIMSSNSKVLASAAADQLRQQAVQMRQSRAAHMQRIAESRPTPAMLDEVEAVLACADTDICFDAFKLAQVSGNHPLSSLAFFLIHRANLISMFSLNPVKLARWLRHVEKGYLRNPYHNSTHAADVLQTLHITIVLTKMQPNYVDSHCLLSCYLAAIMHDFEHRGLTNDYLINTADPLAIRYNDKAPMENHHLAAGFAAMRMSDLDFASGMSKDDYDKMRKVIIELVLATDMKQHFQLLAQYNGARRQWAAAAAMAARHAQAEASQGSDGQGSAGALQALRGSNLGRMSGTHGIASPRQHNSVNRLSVSPPITSTGIAVRSSLQHSGSLPGHVRPTPRSTGNVSACKIADAPPDTLQPASRVPSSPALSGSPEDVMAAPAARRQSLMGSGSSIEIRTSEMSGENIRGSKASSKFHKLEAKAGKWLDSKPSLTGSHLSTTRMSRMLEGYEQYTQEEVMPVDEQERMLSIQMAFKCSDLGHIAESRDVHLKWVAALEEEFFRQGDAERAAGLPISPLFDRNKPGVTKSQVGFFEVVCLPLFKSLVESFPGAKPLLAGVVDNYKHWKLLEKEKKGTTP